jgi:F0F1-type ATP synthase assembly protein I
MASDNLSSNEQMVELITQQTIDFLATMKNDISQCKSLSEDDRKNCEAICQRASIEYNQLKMEFLRETLILIDKALNTSDEKDLGEIHLAWSLQLDYATHQCEHIAIPLIEVARILSKNDEQMEKKYWYCLGSSMVSLLLVGTAYGFFIAHYFPSSLVSLLGKGIFFMGAGTLAASGIAANYKKIPALKDDASTSELATKMKQSIATLNITEDMWHNSEILESIKEVAEARLRNFENST